MLKAILIDDEKNALDALKILLQRHCKNVEVLECAAGGPQGIESIKKHSPDLIFIDIEMPHKNGFDVINETNNFNYQVIFTTAYDQFAIKAFKFSAIDYLLKPVDVEELKAAVEKASKEKPAAGMDEKLKLFFSQFSQQPQTKKMIALPVGDAMQPVAPDEIIRCQSDSNYTHVFLLNDKKITVSKTLKEVEEILSGLSFFRLHHSHLINLNHISKFYKGDNGYVVMTDGCSVTITRGKKDEFMEVYRKI